MKHAAEFLSGRCTVIGSTLLLSAPAVTGSASAPTTRIGRPGAPEECKTSSLIRPLTTKSWMHLFSLARADMLPEEVQ